MSTRNNTKLLTPEESPILKQNLARRRSALIRRAHFLRLVRRALDERGYVEVETPIRVRTPGTDVNLESFACEDRYLITSPEFHMKRLLAAGLLRIYQIAPCFRKGERTSLHNPEFRLLEFYASGLSLEAMMMEVEEVLGAVAQSLGIQAVSYRGLRCRLQSPWQRLTVDAAFRRHAGWLPTRNFDEERFYFDLVDKVDRHLGTPKPTFLYGYPAPLAMLARRDPAHPEIARRFELYLAGIELANAFEELNDPVEQRARFENDLERRRQQQQPLYPVDEVLLDALPDLPPCCGVAVGLDRLFMLFWGGEEIAEVMAFPEEEV